MDERYIPKPVLIGFRSLFGIGGHVFPKTLAKKAADMYLAPMRFPPSARQQKVVDAGTSFELNGGIKAVRWGDENLPIVLLVHGWSGRGAQMTAFVEPLLNAGYQVCAIDLPGHGDTPGETTNPPHSRTALLEVGQQLGPIEAIIAHSFGAACSVWAASDGLDVNKLVLLAGPTVYIHRGFAEFFRLPKRCIDAFVDELSRRMDYPADDIDMEVLKPKAKVDMASKSILMLHGKNDVEVPFWHFEKNETLFPHADKEALEDCGHRVIVWAPAVVEKAVSWLKK